jgi:hypothetical protein
MIDGILCGHGMCGHKAESVQGHLDHGTLHYTVGLMTDPAYLEAVKDIKCAKDDRMMGLEQLNGFHANYHARHLKKAMPPEAVEPVKPPQANEPEKHNEPGFARKV